MKGIHRLTMRQVETAKHDPEHRAATYIPDGGSLYLRVRPGTDGKSWVFKYRHRGSRASHELGLGAFPAVSLAEARKRAGDARLEHKSGIDPISKRREEDALLRGIPTFEAAVAEYIDFRCRQPGKGKLEGSSLVEWQSSLRLHAAALNNMRVDQIQATDVAAALEKVWGSNTSAQRILNRIKEVFGRQIAHRFRTDNPATWDVQKNLLGYTAEGGEGHKALRWQEVPEFMLKLRAEPGAAARALEFIILTGVRISECLGERKAARSKPMMSREEIDLEARLWTIPGSRMKAGVEHRIPLSDRALEILDEVLSLKPSHAYKVTKLAKQLSNGAGTVHGFRSSLRSWAAENGVSEEAAKFMLAHSLVDRVDAAYQRVTRLEERRVAMQRWSDFCLGREDRGAGNVVSLRA